MRKYLTGNVYLIATLAVIAFAYWLSIGALADEQDARQPTLGDLMTLTQLRHLKLWYAHKENNWKLAGYELDQFESTIGRIKKLYPTTS
jgi:hypothetical protein